MALENRRRTDDRPLGVLPLLSVVINVYMVRFMEYTPTQLQNPETLEKMITGSLLSIWLYRISHILDLCLIKTSILLFYHHIAASNRRFHYIIRALLAIIILGGISMFFASLFMCYPQSTTSGTFVQTSGTGVQSSGYA
ncbi:conserved hypothetical protein [Pyrenophora tritici-repentis Pt-1C-BFP]|uniref:Rhodopsin domain-containing protein n=1 Tax=Pyrenophora tritici-repentis (strain Pt-1C-BFP) TaxID=426418 RepID=B2WE66_PYRTR|nr:uncharacterized protein PTRG_08439 [Pyrenophora tritici-repentis Pt-1C-BFP]EDU51358.1 conserved hypothetical protein [Pyrenophora tritici-repentis Pt-1C-BFP]